MDIPIDLLPARLRGCYMCVYAPIWALPRQHEGHVAARFGDEKLFEHANLRITLDGRPRGNLTEAFAGIPGWVLQRYPWPCACGSGRYELRMERGVVRVRLWYEETYEEAA